MKANYQRFTEISSFAIRGPISNQDWKVTQFGLTLLIKEIETPLLISFINAELTPEIIQLFAEFKTQIKELTALKVHFITKDKTLGDYPTLEHFYNSSPSKNMRLVIDRLSLEDEIFKLEKENQDIEDQMKKLGLDKNASEKEVQKNTTAKVQKKAIYEILRWLKKRTDTMKKVPTNVASADYMIRSAMEEIKKHMEKPVEL